MPESPLIQKEVAALTDLEAIIAARAKGETETELVFQRRREREEQEFKAAARQLSTRYKTEKAALEAEYQRARTDLAIVRAGKSGHQRRILSGQAEDRRPGQDGTQPCQEVSRRCTLAGDGDV